ncbi:MAG: DUF3137 domain-containing protein [Wujia sp.]
MDTRQATKNMEEIRKNYRMNMSYLAVITVCLLLSGMAVVRFPNTFFVPFILAVLCFPVVSKMNSLNKQFQYVYKETFARSILEEVFENVTCDWNMGFSEPAVERFGLTQHGNRFSSEDYIKGSYQGVTFEQSDVVVKHVVRSGKQTHTYIYFKGRMFSFDLDKTLDGSVVIFSKSFMYPGNCNGMRHEKVDMESQEFNKTFKTKSIYPHDAFYVLTPQMMECIERLQRTYGNVAMRFVGRKLHVAINMSGDAFNGNINKPIVYVEEKNKIRQDTNVILDIVKTLQMV